MFFFLFAFNLVTSSADAVEPVVLPISPTPYELVPPPGFGPGFVSRSAPLEDGVSGPCSCDDPRLTCAAAGGSITASYALHGMEDYPLTDAVIGHCSVGSVTVPVEARHELSVWHRTYPVSKTDHVVTYERGRPAKFSFWTELPAGEKTFTTDRSAPVYCLASGTGVSVVVNDPTPEDAVYPCVTGDVTMNVRLLGFRVTGGAAQVEQVEAPKRKR